MAFTTLTSASTDFYCLQDGNLQSGAGAIWLYRSGDAAGTISGTTGYFKSVGTSTDGEGSRSGMALGIKVGDVIMAVESSAGVTPGRVSLHGAISSTATSTASGFVSSKAYDVSVQAAATT